MITRKNLKEAETLSDIEAILGGHEAKPGEYPAWYAYHFKSRKEYEARLSFIEVKFLQRLNKDNILEAAILKLSDGFTV